MKSNLEILKEKRNLVISELQNAFTFRSVDLKNLMTDYVTFLKVDGWENQLWDAKDSAIVFMIKKSVSDFYMQSEYDVNIDAKNEFNHQQLQQQKQIFNYSK